MSETLAASTEVIVFASGKGGTGKTSIAASLGYALTVSGHKVLMIDTDRATDGFSLFILGPEGRTQLRDVKPENTFSGFLENFQRSGEVQVEPFRTNRSSENDHGIWYNAIFSGKNVYGDYQDYPLMLVERNVFQRAVFALLLHLRKIAKYDYILIDTRGGFSFESTDVAAAADSFVLVTEATYTNLYQDRNLVARIVKSAAEMQASAVLRGIIVNKATEPPELQFRNELTKVFGVELVDTWPIALDIDALTIYKNQRIIYRDAPGSRFCYDSLQAFKQLLRIVTRQWSVDQGDEWNKLVKKVDVAIGNRNKEVEEEKRKTA